MTKWLELGWQAALAVLLALAFTAWVNPSTPAGTVFLFVVAALGFGVVVALATLAVKRLTASGGD